MHRTLQRERGGETAAPLRSEDARTARGRPGGCAAGPPPRRGRHASRGARAPARTGAPSLSSRKSLRKRAWESEPALAVLVLRTKKATLRSPRRRVLSAVLLVHGAHD